MSDKKERNYRAHSRTSRRKENASGNSWLVVGGVIVIVLVLLILIVNSRKSKPEAEVTVESTATAETLDSSKLRNSYEIDLSEVPGLAASSFTCSAGKDRSELLESFSKLYTWKVEAVNSSANTGEIVKPTVAADETTAVGSGDVTEEVTEQEEEVAALREIVVQDKLSMTDVLAEAFREVLDQIFEDDLQGTDVSSINIYSLKLSNLEAAISEFAQDADDMWYVEAKGGSIDSYDAETDEFLMEGASTGSKVDKEKLIRDLTEQLEKGNYVCSVPVRTEEISSEGSIENGEYQIIAQYITHTTNNSVRNKNVSLACENLNGTIVRPGEEFSYNYTIGERTEEKGYGTAAAYSNGEVVQEVGGGVCQVSSTLYNAITEAGLKTTYRSPHTFKPTYVTPGQDATVSWNGPDYRFANVIAFPELSYENTYAIGIKAVYDNQTVTVTIWGRPVLKSGYTMTMESEMTEETEVVRVLIEEGSDKEPTEGDKGSVWKTYLHIQKDGQDLSRDLYHTTRYKGHTEYYLEEESTEETSESETESAPEELGPGYSNVRNDPVKPDNGVNSDGPGTEVEVTESSAVNEGAHMIDAPGGIPGISETEGSISDGPQIIQDGP